MSPKYSLDKMGGTSEMADFSAEKTRGIQVAGGRSSLGLQYADIIKITAPSNEKINDHTFFVDYIDQHLLRIFDIARVEENYTYKIEWNEQEKEGFLIDTSIEKISLISRNEELGYIQNHRLKKGDTLLIEWSNPHIPAIRTKITAIVMDALEIVDFETQETLYIDFEYKGLPEFIHSIRVVSTEETPSVAEDPMSSYPQLVEEEEIPADIGTTALQTLTKQGDMLFREIVSVNDIAEDLDAVEVEMEIPENLQRYTLEVQIEDVSDHLYSRYPKHLHTPELSTTITTEIARFVEMRQKFSDFQENGVILPKKTEIRPILRHFVMDTSEYPYRAFVPIVNLRKKVTLDCYDAELANETAFSIGVDDDELRDLETLWNHYKTNVQRGDENRLGHLIRSITVAPFLKPAFPSNNLFFTPVKTHVPQEYWTAQDYDPAVSLHLKVIKNGRGGENSECSVYGPVKTGYVKQRFLKGEEAAISSFYIPEFHTILNAKTPATPFYQETLSLTPPTLNSVQFVPIQDTDELYAKYDETVITLFQKPSRSRPTNIHPPYASKPACFYVKPNTTVSKMEMLQAITPTTTYLIQFMKHMGFFDDVYSLQQAVKKMAGWAIDTENLRRSEGEEIRSQIDKNIRTFMKNWRLRSGELLKQVNMALGYYKPSNVQWNNLYTLFSSSIEGLERLEQLKTAYQIDLETPTTQTGNAADAFGKKTHYTNSEIFQTMYRVDHGRLLHLCFISLILDWLTPEQFLSGVPEIYNTGSQSAEHKVFKTLSKKYTTESDLEKDNQTDEPVYVDADLLDGTTQGWIRSFDSVLKKAKSEEEKREIVFQTLTDVQQMTPQAAEELTDTVLTGKRRVEDGEYAVLEKKQRATYDNKKHKDIIMARRYYKRIQGLWRLDEKLKDEDFGEDIENLLHTSKQRNTPEETKKAILFEFERRYSKISETMKQQIAEDIDEQMRGIVRKREWERAKSHRLNTAMNKQVLLYAEEKRESVVSPYAVLRDLVMEQTNEAKRQYDIVRFFQQYCRKATLTENPCWGYCLLTNTPLFPISIYELAVVFNTGKTRAYKKKIEEVRSQYGVLSEDGGSWVDRESGYTICILDYAAEGGDTMEYRQMAVADQVFKETEIQGAIDVLFSSNEVATESVKGNDVVSVLVRFLNKQIGIQRGGENILQEIQVLYQNTIQDPRIVTTAEKYEKVLQKSPPGKMPPYNTYVDRMKVYVAVSSYFAMLQLHSHEITRSNVSGPIGCSFTIKGYPQVNDPEKDDGIHYMACLLQETAKIDERPWKSMNQQSVKVMVKNIKTVLQNMLSNTPSLKNALKTKEELHPQDKEEIQIQAQTMAMNWPHFLPPVLPFSVKSQIKGEEQARQMYLDEFTGSRKKKDDALLKLQGLSRLITYAAVERINDIVSKKKMLMRTMNNTPFLENTCCDDDTRSRNPAFYFCQEDPTLLKHIQLVREIDNDVKKIAEMSSSPFLFYKGFSWTTTFQTATPVIQESTVKHLFTYHLYDRGLWKRPDIQALYSFPSPPENYSREWTPVAKMAMFQETVEKSGKWSDIRPLYNEFIRKINQDNTQEKKQEHDVLSLRTEQKTHFLNASDLLGYERQQTLYNSLLEWQTEEPTVAFTTGKINPYRKALLTRLEKDGIVLPKMFLVLEEKPNNAILRNKILYLKNSFWYLTRYNPIAALQKDREKFRNLPEHWVFSDSDMEKIQKNVVKNTRFYRPGNFPAIQPLIETYLEKIAVLRKLFSVIPEELFSQNVLWHLYSYLLVEAVYLHIETYYEKYYEMAVGQDTEVKIVLKDYLKTVLGKMEKMGEWVELTYEKIRERTQVDVDMEKNTMKQYLKEMTNEERKVENEMKKHKLGKWNVGKEVYIYDKRKQVVGVGMENAFQQELDVEPGEDEEENQDVFEEEEEEEDGGYDVDEGYDDNGNDDDFGYEE